MVKKKYFITERREDGFVNIEEKEFYIAEALSESIEGKKVEEVKEQ